MERRGGRMRKFLEGRVLFSFFLAAVGALAVAYAHYWPFKAALFPLMTGIPLLVLALAQGLLDLRGRLQTREGPAMDLQQTSDVPAELARRRTIAIFAWMAGFILLVLLIGFTLAVPLFAFCYLIFQRSVGFGTSVVTAVGAWAFFYVLFERILQLQFEAGLVQIWLGL
jgi:Tripartite tricarboxylate transporter TctB family